MEERIKELEEQIKCLKKEKEELAKYEKMKEIADEGATQLAMFRDSLCEKGFTVDQAVQFMLAGMGANFR